MKKNIVLLAVFALVLALAPAAQAQTTIEFFTDSDQLNLAGREVLAAVNFYAPTDRGSNGTPGHVAVGSIQGQAFTNFDENSWTSILPTAFSHPVTQGTLTMSGNSKGGRESTNGTNGYVAITGPDATEANKLGAAGWYSGATGQDNDMDFAFGAEWANTEVEVQLIGGGTSPNSNEPRWDVFVNADTGDEFKGTFISNDGTPFSEGPNVGPGNPYLMTFLTTLDASGDLFIDVDYGFGTAARDIHLRGAIVTVAPAAAAAVPEPASIAIWSLLGLCLAGYGYLRRRRNR